MLLLLFFHVCCSAQQQQEFDRWSATQLLVMVVIIAAAATVAVAVVRVAIAVAVVVAAVVAAVADGAVLPAASVVWSYGLGLPSLRTTAMGKFLSMSLSPLAAILAPRCKFARASHPRCCSFVSAAQARQFRFHADGHRNA